MAGNNKIAPLALWERKGSSAKSCLFPCLFFLSCLVPVFLCPSHIGIFIVESKKFFIIQK